MQQPSSIRVNSMSEQRGEMVGREQKPVTSPEQGIQLLVDERQKWHEHSLLGANEAVAGPVEPSETAKGLARVLGLNHMIAPILAEFPELANDDPRRQIAMARIALEFFDKDEFTTPEAIAYFLRKSPEVALLVGATKEESSHLTDIDTFIEESSKHAQNRSQITHSDLIMKERAELRYALSRPPALFAIFGSAALYSYNAYISDTEKTFMPDIIGKILEKLDDKDEPALKLDRSHLVWLQKLVGNDAELNGQWFRKVNFLAFLGSEHSAYRGGKAVNAAKELFYDYLRLDDDVIRRYRSQVKPYRFIQDVNLLSAYGVTNIDVIAREAFRVFREGDGTLEAKLQAIVSKGYDFGNPEVQSLLPRMLLTRLTALEEKLPPYRPGITKEAIMPKPGPKKSTLTGVARPVRKKPTQKVAQETEPEEPADQSSKPQSLPTQEQPQQKPAAPEVEANLSAECLSLARSIALYLDIDRTEEVLAHQLGLSQLSERQLNELNDFIENYETDLTMTVIRTKISTLEF